MSTTLVSLWGDIRKRLEAVGVDTPVIDARLLLEAGAGVSRLDIVTDPRRVLADEQVAAVEALARRREAREPISHILGKKAFWSLDFVVTPAVLTPRPETELLVEVALAAIEKEGAARVLDLGAGSGAILLSILHERPFTTGLGVDVSEAALVIAQANAERLGLKERATFELADWGASSSRGAFDLVVSNPPYIPTREIESLDPEVAIYEPRLALDGGADGLAAYRQIFAALPELLMPGGVFAVEVGQGQAERVAELAAAAGLVMETTRFDLAGVPRVVWGRRPLAPSP